MAQVRVQEAASYRLDEIYRYTRDRWGVEQADRYINGLFDAFEGIDAHEVASRPIPADSASRGSTFATSAISSIGDVCRTATSAS